MPTIAELRDSLADAGKAHHDYESNYLNGERDQQWAGWYAAYVLGRLGDFASPTELTKWLEEISGEGDWSENAASLVAAKIGS